jgi:hypothetical protein
VGGWAAGWEAGEEAVPRSAALVSPCCCAQHAIHEQPQTSVGQAPMPATATGNMGECTCHVSAGAAVPGCTVLRWCRGMRRRPSAPSAAAASPPPFHCSPPAPSQEEGSRQSTPHRKHKNMRGRQHTAARPELEHAPLLASFLPRSIASANEQLLHTLPALNSTGAPQFAYTIRLLPRCRRFLHTHTKADCRGMVVTVGFLLEVERR